MPAPKIVDLVSSCGKCPNYQYYSGGVHKCKPADEIVLDKDEIAPFCPLPNYPSHQIASMQRTILDLREPNKAVFVLALLSHIATKLKLNLEPHGGGIVIPFKDGDKDREVYLSFEYITEVAVSPFSVIFQSGGKKFKLSPDFKPPTLDEEAPKVPGLEDKELWTSHRL